MCSQAKKLESCGDSSGRPELNQTQFVYVRSRARRAQGWLNCFSGTDCAHLDSDHEQSFGFHLGYRKSLYVGGNSAVCHRKSSLLHSLYFATLSVFDIFFAARECWFNPPWNAQLASRNAFTNDSPLVEYFRSRVAPPGCHDLSAEPQFR